MDAMNMWYASHPQLFLHPPGSNRPGCDIYATFVGLGHTIDNMKITSSTSAGFIGTTGDTTVVRDLGLTNVDITSTNMNTSLGVGALIGSGSGKIYGVYSTGKVTGYGQVGGLIGSFDAGEIAYSFSEADVSGVSRVGGLVGYSREDIAQKAYPTNIKHSHFTGTFATLTNNQSGNIGGLVGYLGSGNIYRSYAAADIISDLPASADNTQNLGGLVGGTVNQLTIEDSFATGDIEGGFSLGGLVGAIEITNVAPGDPTAKIARSYATGNVKGKRTGYILDFGTGGLIGSILDDRRNPPRTDGVITIDGVFAAGNVSNANTLTGGLIGVAHNARASNFPITVENSYAVGTVTGGGWQTGQVIGKGTALTNGEYSAEHLADTNIQRTILEGGDVNGAIQGYENAKVEAAQRAAAEEAARQAAEAARLAAEEAARYAAAQEAAHTQGKAEQLSRTGQEGEISRATEDFTRARSPLAAALHALSPTNNYLSAIGDVAIDGFTYSAAERPNADCPEGADCKP
jgi:hypothetical protein